MKSSIFWGVTPYNLLKVNLHIPLSATSFPAGILLGLFFDPED
jgi:hypothetical protein